MSQCAPSRSSTLFGSRRVTRTLGRSATWLAPLDRHLVDDDVVDRAILRANPHLADLPHDIHPVLDDAEDRVAVVEVWRGAERDEELRAVGVRPGVGHREDALAVVAQARMELVGELVARAAESLAERIATLNHEAVDDAVEDDAVVEGRGFLLAVARVRPLPGPLGEADEVGDGVGHFLIEQTDREAAFGGVEAGKGTHAPIVHQAYFAAVD